MSKRAVLLIPHEGIITIGTFTKPKVQGATSTVSLRGSAVIWLNTQYYQVVADLGRFNSSTNLCRNLPNEFVTSRVEELLEQHYSKVKR